MIGMDILSCGPAGFGFLFFMFLPVLGPLALLVAGMITWWLAGALAELPRRKQDDRRHAGRCTLCGYDLRATPLQCPECGLHVQRR